MQTTRMVTKVNEEELELGIAGTAQSWHEQYVNCPYVFVGNLPFHVDEEQVAVIFEQVGVVNMVDLVRDKDTRKSRGFCYLQFANSKSAILAIDNFNGCELFGRRIRVDHASNYKRPENANNEVAETGTQPVLDVSRVQREVEHHIRATSPERHEEDAARENRIRQRMERRKRRRGLEEPGSTPGQGLLDSR
mmetsp:Transcript_49865/g.122425  ORF Transcript_49865/g.122425 Transcript_49865/m.122425 type:complete len:192 (-) Transcript_49865:2316-2891(-)